MSGTSNSAAAPSTSSARNGSRYESNKPAKFTTIGRNSDFQKVLAAVLLDLGVTYQRTKDITQDTVQRA